MGLKQKETWALVLSLLVIPRAGSPRLGHHLLCVSSVLLDTASLRWKTECRVWVICEEHMQLPVAVLGMKELSRTSLAVVKWVLVPSPHTCATGAGSIVTWCWWWWWWLGSAAICPEATLLLC